MIPGLLKFIPENVRHNSPNYLRYKIASWVDDDTNFHDGADRTALDSLEQRPASNGGSFETDQVINHEPLLQENPQEKPHSKNLLTETGFEQFWDAQEKLAQADKECTGEDDDEFGQQQKQQQHPHRPSAITIYLSLATQNTTIPYRFSS